MVRHTIRPRLCAVSMFVLLENREVNKKQKEESINFYSGQKTKFDKWFTNIFTKHTPQLTYANQYHVMLTDY